MKAALPDNESQRLTCLGQLALLNSTPEKSFDDIAQLAAEVCATPVALVSLVDAERQWFKASIGLDIQETPRDYAFCAHAILAPEETLVVENALADKRFADNPLVRGQPGIRFYAGVPLVTEEGFALGTLCVIDYQPRHLMATQLTALEALARLAMQQIKLRTALLASANFSEQLALIANSVPVLIGQLDQQQRYIFCNRKYQEWWQLTPESMLGKTPKEVLGDAADRLQPAIDACYRGEAQQFESATTSGVLAELQYLPHIREGKVAGMFILATDITERVAHEQMKNEFVSSVSHELRTPLTSISGALGLMVNESLGPIPEAYKRLLDIAHKNTRRLSLLINDLLDMEKLLAGKMHFDCRLLPLSNLLEKSLYENQTYANQYGVNFSWSDKAGSVLVRVDEHRFLQIMANLLSNAVKFSPPNGKVLVESQRWNEGCRIWVIDQGPGIPVEFQARLFQKFSQADASDARRKGGTGLGLAISRELVEKMDGRIGVISQPGKGARFFIELPCVAGQQESS